MSIFSPTNEARKMNIPPSPISHLPSPRKPLKLVPAGSVVVRIYGKKNSDGEKLGPFTIAWRDSAQAPRRRAMRSQWKSALSFAETKATRLANNEAWRDSISQLDWQVYTESVETLSRAGLPARSLLDAAQLLASSALRTPAPPVRTIPDLVTDLLQDKTGLIGARWRRALKGHLDRFSQSFTGPLHALASADINAWLRQLAVGPRSRHNYRAAIEQLVRFAQANGQLDRSWKELDHVPDPKLKPIEIKILSPEQCTKLLAARQAAEENGRAQRSLVPFLALQAFAGVRHEEMRGEKALLDWRNIDLDARQVYVPKTVAKTGRDRTVPMSDNLAAWLAPYLKRNGPICELSNTSSALCRAKKSAGLACGKNQTRNTLRKSYISYRLALTKNAAQVAEEAGNSVAKIRTNYGRPLPVTEGKRWFDIWPTQAEVLQLNFAGI
jgi:integrase